YTTIVAEVVQLVEQPPLRGCVLGVDFTGVGRPVVDLLRQAGPRAFLRPVLITAGHEVSRDGAGFHVPKVTLVSTVATLLHSRRLEIPAEIPERKVLEKELLAFRARVTVKGNET